MTSLSRSVGIGSNSQLLAGAFITYLVVSSILTCLNFLSAMCARAQSISQHVDAGQLNVPPQQQPITLSLTKVTPD